MVTPTSANSTSVTVKSTVLESHSSSLIPVQTPNRTFATSSLSASSLITSSVVVSTSFVHTKVVIGTSTVLRSRNFSSVSLHPKPTASISYNVSESTIPTAGRRTTSSASSFRRTTLTAALVTISKPTVVSSTRSLTTVSDHVSSALVTFVSSSFLSPSFPVSPSRLSTNITMTSTIQTETLRSSLSSKRQTPSAGKQSSLPFISSPTVYVSPTSSIVPTSNVTSSLGLIGFEMLVPKKEDVTSISFKDKLESDLVEAYRWGLEKATERRKRNVIRVEERKLEPWKVLGNKKHKLRQQRFRKAADSLIAQVSRTLFSFHH